MIWKKPSAYIDRHWHAFPNDKIAMSLCGEIYISTAASRRTMASLPPKGRCNECLKKASSHNWNAK